MTIQAWNLVFVLEISDQIYVIGHSKIADGDHFSRWPANWPPEVFLFFFI